MKYSGVSYASGVIPVGYDMHHCAILVCISLRFVSFFFTRSFLSPSSIRARNKR